MAVNKPKRALCAFWTQTLGHTKYTFCFFSANGFGFFSLSFSKVCRAGGVCCYEQKCESAQGAVRIANRLHALRAVKQENKATFPAGGTYTHPCYQTAERPRAERRGYPKARP